MSLTPNPREAIAQGCVALAVERAAPQQRVCCSLEADLEVGTRRFDAIPAMDGYSFEVSIEEGRERPWPFLDVTAQLLAEIAERMGRAILTRICCHESNAVGQRRLGGGERCLVATAERRRSTGDVRSEMNGEPEATPSDRRSLL